MPRIAAPTDSYNAIFVDGAFYPTGSLRAEVETEAGKQRIIVWHGKTLVCQGRTYADFKQVANPFDAGTDTDFASIVELLAAIAPPQPTGSVPGD